MIPYHPVMLVNNENTNTYTCNLVGREYERKAHTNNPPVTRLRSLQLGLK